MLLKYFLFMMWASFVCAMDAPEEPNLSPSQKTLELNVMWLNEALSTDQDGLFRNKEEETHTQCIANAVTQNQDIRSVNVWYNSRTTSDESLHYTQNNIQNLLAQRNVSSNNLSFKDIWDMPYVQQHADAFSKNPIYFVSDLARVAVLCDKTTDARIKIYSDLNIPIKSISSLLKDMSERGLSTLLDKYGFALAKNHGGDLNYAYENAFIALDTENEEAVHAFQFAILDMNVQRASYFQAKNLWETWSNAELKTKTQIVFASFKPMFSYLKYLMGEYGINDDQQNMPNTLEGRINRYPDPRTLFDLMTGSSSRVTYKYGRDETEKDYVGYQLAGKMHRSGVMVDDSGYIDRVKRIVYTALLNAGREYTVDVDKPISSFY